MVIRYWKLTNKAQNTYKEVDFPIAKLGYTPDTWDELDDERQEEVIKGLPKIKYDFGHSIVR